MNQSPQHYAPLPPTAKSSSNAKIIILVLVALLAICMVGCGLLAALLLPAVAAARDAARLQRTTNNMREIGLALLNYESTYKSFPAIHSINHDKVPTMSWRYAISPFLGSEGSQVFSEFVQQANLPWDSPEHEPMLGKMPMQFRSLEARPDQSPTHTNVFGIVGATEAFAGGGKYRRMSDFTDGTSNCIVAICLPTYSVSWNDPNGLTPEEAIQKIRSSPRPERVLLLYADGSVRRVESMSDKELRVGMTINQGDFATGPF